MRSYRVLMSGLRSTSGGSLNKVVFWRAVIGWEQAALDALLEMINKAKEGDAA